MSKETADIFIDLNTRNTNKNNGLAIVAAIMARYLAINKAKKEGVDIYKAGLEDGLKRGNLNPMNVAGNVVAGTLANTIVQKAIEELPKIGKNVIEKSGYGGYERGLRDAKSQVLSQLEYQIKNAGLIELFKYCNTLVTINPTANTIKTSVQAITICYIVWKTLNHLAEWFTSFLAIESAKKIALGEISNRLNYLLGEKIISPQRYSELIQLLTNKKTLETISEFSKNLYDNRFL